MASSLAVSLLVFQKLHFTLERYISCRDGTHERYEHEMLSGGLHIESLDVIGARFPLCHSLWWTSHIKCIWKCQWPSVDLSFYPDDAPLVNGCGDPIWNGRQKGNSGLEMVRMPSFYSTRRSPVN